jgi:putative transcriptional regulator
MKTIIARIRNDGTVVEVLSDGSERPFPTPPPMREMTDEEVHAAALSDPDAQPWTEEARRHAKPVPRIKTLRRALRLTLEEFSSRYHIPLETLQDWEQGRSVPDQTARAYLRVIATQPEMVQRSLQVEPQPA